MYKYCRKDYMWWLYVYLHVIVCLNICDQWCKPTQRLMTSYLKYPKNISELFSFGEITIFTRGLRKAVLSDHTRLRKKRLQSGVEPECLGEMNLSARLSFLNYSTLRLTNSYYYNKYMCESVLSVCYHVDRKFLWRRLLFSDAIFLSQNVKDTKHF